MSKEILTLSKWLATCGITSRRKATDIIRNREVTVNGLVATNPARRLKPNDIVQYQGKTVAKSEHIYLMLNKPAGFITTTSDELGRHTVLELISPYYRRLHVFPIGRLDQDTTGLILLTNDGACAQRLAHPRYQMRKTYRVLVNRPLTVIDSERIKRGISLRDGFVKPDRLVFESNTKRFVVLVQLHSGKKRVIRRMFAALNYHVTSLERVAYAGLSLGSLAPGAWRLLRPQEIELLHKEPPKKELPKKQPQSQGVGSQKNAVKAVK